MYLGITLSGTNKPLPFIYYNFFGIFRVINTCKSPGVNLHHGTTSVKNIMKERIKMKHGALITKHLGLGDSRKYPYPTTGSMNILTPPPPPHPFLTFRNSKMVYPYALQILKLLISHPFQICVCHFNPLEFFVWLPTTFKKRHFMLLHLSRSFCY